MRRIAPDPSVAQVPGPTPVSLHDLLAFERLLSDLSARFIALPPQDIDGAIDDSLARIVSTLHIDRSTLSRVFPLSGRMEVTHSFAAEGIGPALTNVSAREFAPWSLKMMMANRPVVFERDLNVSRASLRRSISLAIRFRKRGMKDERKDELREASSARMTGLFLYTRAREHCLQIVVAVAAVGKWETRAVERGRFPLFHQPIR